MVVSFKNDRDRVFYESEKSLTSAYNVRIARKILQRINELLASDNPQQLPRNARFHEHKGKRKGLFSIDLVHPYRLIVRPTCSYANYIEIVSVEIDEVFNPHK